ncbi:MAG: hypothetical protein CL912_01865 [Deltaproteobacteria bacterium]|nr:hypothetical protein [Deltaproteobacteria bacterium]
MNGLDKFPAVVETWKTHLRSELKQFVVFGRRVFVTGMRLGWMDDVTWTGEQDPARRDQNADREVYQH